MSAKTACLPESQAAHPKLVRLSKLTRFSKLICFFQAIEAHGPCFAVKHLAQCTMAFTRLLQSLYE